MSQHRRIAEESLRGQGVFAGHRTLDWGEEVVETVVEYFEEGYFGQYPDDNLGEIADASVPIYTQDLLTLAADSPDLANYDGHLGIESETVEEKLTATLYEVAWNIAYAAHRELADDYEEDDS